LQRFECCRLVGDVVECPSCCLDLGDRGVSGPTLLVGHSYGATVITAAGADDRVGGLVYIAALAPDEDETSLSQQDKFPVTGVFSYIEVAGGRVWMLPDGVECFAETCPSRNRSSSGRPTSRRTQTFSTSGSTAPPGGRSRPRYDADREGQRRDGGRSEPDARYDEEAGRDREGQP
jgi:pimeloyl-ACP methyl ester carboxylesterase